VILQQHYLGCLSQASYLIGDETSGRAVVVDPLRDIDQYIDAAAADNLAIEAVINTHIHADFVAGHLELAAATGAWIGYGERAQTEYPIRTLVDGEHLRLGQVDLEVLATPGHTPESISLVVREHADDDVPSAVLTGDCLFIGDVGRVDLQASPGEEMLALAGEQYESVHQRLLSLPDQTRVFPAHGAGSACGRNLSSETQSTIGQQRAVNYACQPMSKEEFVRLITEGQASPPRYFALAASLNRQQHPLLGQTASSMDAATFQAARRAGARVIDTRAPEDFAAGHLAGAVNIPIDGRFAETAGMFLDYQHDDVVVVAEDDRSDEVVTRLGRVGFDRVLGALASGPSELGRFDESLEQASRLEPTAVADRLAGEDPPTILDVRGPGERADGYIPGSMSIPLPELVGRVQDVPAGEVVVHCASGWRSSVAASYLRREGRGKVSDLLGGFQAWQSQQPDAAVTA